MYYLLNCYPVAFQKHNARVPLIILDEHEDRLGGAWRCHGHHRLLCLQVRQDLWKDKPITKGFIMLDSACFFLIWLMVSFLYGNIHAGLWALGSGILSAIVLHLHLLFLNHRLAWPRCSFKKIESTFSFSLTDFPPGTRCTAWLPTGTWVFSPWLSGFHICQCIVLKNPFSQPRFYHFAPSPFTVHRSFVLTWNLAALVQQCTTFTQPSASTNLSTQ